MAALAADAFVHVDAVVEIDKIRQVVHPHPLQRFSRAIALPHRLQHGRARPYLPVAVHAGLGRRDAGKIGILDGGVAVAAVNAHAAHVVLMAEGRVLHPRLVLPGHVLRALQLGQHRAQRHQHKKQTQDRHPRQRIGTAMKKLRHRANGSLAVERRARSHRAPELRLQNWVAGPEY